MRVLSVFRKTLLEQARDWASLSMVLVLCPFFVLLYWFISGGGTTSYKVLIINRDRGLDVAGQGIINEGQRVVEALNALRYKNGAPILRVEVVSDRAKADEQLENRYAAALLIIPEGFSAALHPRQDAAPAKRPAVTIAGDASNPAYMIASALMLTAADAIAQAISGYQPPVGWAEEFVGSGKPRTEFELYVPGLLILSIILLVFTTALPLVREREERTLRRLRVSCMTSFDLLGGISLTQIVLGAVSVALTFVVAAALGFRSNGSLFAAALVGVLTAGSVIAVGLVTACFCKNATAVLTIGTLPFFLLMWFTGAAMPIGRVNLFTWGSRQIAANDLLPPTHAVVALNKILSFGASLADIGYEIAMLVGLTALYFAAAVWIYQRTQLRKE
jgi:ABC-2 type transport system permease protein